MACFHIPGVTCENCAHLEKGSAKGPWVGVVTTGGTYFWSHDLTDAMQRLTLERDEARAERDALHLALRQVLDALGNGSGATEEASVEFLCHAPEEVRAVVADLRGEMIAARAEEKAAVEAADAARASLERAITDRDHAEKRAREYLLDGGAAEMRERAASAVEEADDGVPLQNLADHIRTLPMPGDEG